MKKIITLLFTTLMFFGLSGNVLGQYDGTGLFTEITSIGELTDGYYVVASADGEFAMNNTNSGYFEETAITPSGGELTNPSGSIVWHIEVDGSGRTVYNEDNEVYVS